MRAQASRPVHLTLRQDQLDNLISAGAQLMNLASQTASGGSSMPAPSASMGGPTGSHDPSGLNTTQTYGPAASFSRGRGNRSKRGQSRGRGQPRGRGGKSRQRDGRVGKPRFGQTGAKQGKKTSSYEKAFLARAEDYDPNAVGYVQPVSAQPAGVPSTSGTPGSNWPPGVTLVSRPEDPEQPEASEQNTEQKKKLLKISKLKENSKISLILKEDREPSKTASGMERETEEPYRG